MILMPARDVLVPKSAVEGLCPLDMGVELTVFTEGIDVGGQLRNELTVPTRSDPDVTFMTAGADPKLRAAAFEHIQKVGIVAMPEREAQGRIEAGGDGTEDFFSPASDVFQM